MKTTWITGRKLSTPIVAVAAITQRRGSVGYYPVSKSNEAITETGTNTTPVCLEYAHPNAA